MVNLKFWERASKKEAKNADTAKKGKATFVPKWKETHVTPDVTFPEQADAYEQQAEVQQSIMFQAEEVVGDGLHMVAEGDPTYLKYKIPNGNKEWPEEWTAQEFLDEAARAMELDSKVLFTMARDILAFGNAFLWIKDLDRPEMVPISAIYEVDAKNSKVKIAADYRNDLKEIPFEELLFMVWNLKQDSTLGEGIIEPLLRGYDNTLNILEVQADFIQNQNLAAKNFAQGNGLVILPGASDEEIDSYNKEKKTLGGQWIFTNMEDAKMMGVMIDRGPSWDKLIDMVDNYIVVATGNPLLRSMMVPGLAPGNMQAIAVLHDRRIRAIRKIIKRGLEDYGNKLLKEKGFDPRKVDVKVDWNPERKEVTLEQLIALHDKQVISDAVLKEHLKKLGVDFSADQKEES